MFIVNSSGLKYFFLIQLSISYPLIQPTAEPGNTVALHESDDAFNRAVHHGSNLKIRRL
ncbi:hypothetical protein SAMN05192563_106226 [Paraburkholderia aspalathi]|uniref:Uncharacterized protein n=1 Tax=Paraburkholderia aspalathi TaxID=1324617 RepID=A0A1I7ERZ7_9BURK|nr:hypothetical protein SAMN05192563_106226 [Paraburkholderia aspalathi]